MELRLPLEMSPGREATCRAAFGTWGFFRTMHGKTAPSCIALQYGRLIGRIDGAKDRVLDRGLAPQSARWTPSIESSSAPPQSIQSAGGKSKPGQLVFHLAQTERHYCRVGQLAAGPEAADPSEFFPNPPCSCQHPAVAVIGHQPWKISANRLCQTRRPWRHAAGVCLWAPDGRNRD